MIKEKDDIIYIKRRKIKHWLAVLIFLVVVLIAVKTEISNVNVIGNSTYTAEEAIDMVFSDRTDRNTLLCLINKIRNEKKQLPFIADYDIRLTGPFSCNLIIYEKEPVGCIRYMGSYMYFDSGGTVVESSQQRLEGVPVVEGIDFGHIVIGEELPNENGVVFTDVMNVTQQLSSYGISCDKIVFENLENITITLNGGDIEVSLGTNSDLAAKISVLRDMLPSIEEKGLKGSLDLSGYTDTGENQSVSFKVRENPENSNLSDNLDKTDENLDAE